MSGWPERANFSQPLFERTLDQRVAAHPNVRLLAGGTSPPNSVVRAGELAATGDLGFAHDWLVVDLVLPKRRVVTPHLAQIFGSLRPSTLVSGPARRAAPLLRQVQPPGQPGSVAQATSRPGASHGPGRTGLSNDVVVHRGPVVLAVDRDLAPALSPAARGAGERLDGTALQSAATAWSPTVDGTYADWFARHGIGVALFRPDGSVFGTAADVASADDLVADLAQRMSLLSPAPRAEATRRRLFDVRVP